MALPGELVDAMVLKCDAFPEEFVREVDSLQDFVGGPASFL